MDDARKYFHRVQRKKRLIKKGKSVLMAILTIISVLVVAICIYLYCFHGYF